MSDKRDELLEAARGLVALMADDVDRDEVSDAWNRLRIAALASSPEQPATDKRDELLLREALAKTINLCGGFARPDASVEFLCIAPAEVEAKIAALASPPEQPEGQGDAVERARELLVKHYRPVEGNSAVITLRHAEAAVVEALATPRDDAQASDVERAANALKGFSVKDDEGWGWSLTKAERENAARRVLSALPAQPCDKLVDAGKEALRELDVFASLVRHYHERKEVQAIADNFREALSAWERR